MEAIITDYIHMDIIMIQMIIHVVHLEVLKMYKYLNNSKYNIQYNNILQLYKNQIEKIISLQDNNTIIF